MSPVVSQTLEVLVMVSGVSVAASKPFTDAEKNLCPQAAPNASVPQRLRGQTAHDVLSLHRSLGATAKAAGARVALGAAGFTVGGAAGAVVGGASALFVATAQYPSINNIGCLGEDLARGTRLGMQVLAVTGLVVAAALPSLTQEQVEVVQGVGKRAAHALRGCAAGAALGALFGLLTGIFACFATCDLDDEISNVCLDNTLVLGARLGVLTLAGAGLVLGAAPSLLSAEAYSRLKKGYVAGMFSMGSGFLGALIGNGFGQVLYWMLPEFLRPAQGPSCITAVTRPAFGIGAALPVGATTYVNVADDPFVAVSPA